MNIKKKSIQWLLMTALSASSSFLIAQPVVLNPLTSSENTYASASPNNNTGNDICLVTTPSTLLVNVMVYEDGNDVFLTHQYVTSNSLGTVITLGAALPVGTIFSDPDVVSVVSTTPEIGTPKEKIIIVYIADTPGSSNPRTFMEMYEWSDPTFVLSGGPFDLSTSAGTLTCNTPNVDADYLGNYAISWEEDTRVFMTSDNAFTSWGLAPTRIIDYSTSCGATPTQKEPDVCLIPYSESNSIINVSFRSENTLFLERLTTDQIPLPSGIHPFPTSNCTSPMLYSQDFTPDVISGIRIACPPTETTSRNMLDMTIAFKHTESSYPYNTNIITATHSLINYPPMGTISFNMLNVSGSSSYPAYGIDYYNSQPAIAYKMDANEFVVAWEFTDAHTGAANAYFPVTVNNIENLVAVRCSDANIPMNFDMSSTDDVVSPSSTAESASISKGDFSIMQYAFIKNSAAIRYNSFFSGTSLKKENTGTIWFVDYAETLDNRANFVELNDIEVYPNPIAFQSGEIKIELNNTQATEISILTIDGRQVYRANVTFETSVTIPNSFAKGTYFLVIQTNENQITKKLIVQ